MKFEVMRQHLGDRMYFPGDEREIAEADARHLVANGVLRKVEAKAKAEPKPANKAEPAAKNKAK